MIADYREVVEKRYNVREKEIDVFDSLYSDLNPVGFYIRHSVQKVLCQLVRELYDRGMDFRKADLFDMGCGVGDNLRYLAELKMSTDGLFGADLSTNKIDRAKKINPNIDYMVLDVVEMEPIGRTFDVITSFDMFMHLQKREHVEKGLRNLNKLLNSNGYLFWYDPFDNDHFREDARAEGIGFHPTQMEELAKSQGFRKIRDFSVFKYMYGDVRFSTAYMADRLPVWLLHAIEKEMPGSPVTIGMLFQKR